MGRRQYRTDGWVDLAGQRVAYQMVRTVGRQSVHLVVDPTRGLEVRAPYHFAATSAAGLIQQHADWVLRELAQQAARRPARLRAGSELPFLSERLTISAAPRHRPRVRRVGRMLWVDGANDPNADIAPVVEAWYRTEAKRHFAARVKHLAPQFGGRLPSRISVRGQRTRWGSCSSNGTISLNWRLMMVAPPLVDYVVAHELCHLTHMDHSAAFWALLEKGMPQAREHRAALATPPEFPL